MLMQQKDQAVQKLGSFAGAIREAGRKLQDEDQESFGRYADQAATQMEKVSNYLREKDVSTFIRDTETFARRRPDLFLGGTFLAGLLLARFLKSSSPEGGNWDGRDSYRPSLPVPARSEFTPERRNPDETGLSSGYQTYNAPLGV
jgi:hypothetical protein